MSKLNVKAKPFSFNPGASSWSPPAAAPAKVAAAPAKAPTKVARPNMEVSRPNMEVAAPDKAAPTPEPVKDNWDDVEPVKAAPAKKPVAEKVAPAKVAAPEPAPVKVKVAAPEPAAKEPKSSPTNSKKNAVANTKVHDTREHLNIVFIGHVDAGKSTISGQILCVTNQIDDRTLAKYTKEAKEKNRDTWFLAYIMDTNEEERAKGKTVEVGRAHFTTTNKRYTLLDAPGHKNYVPNMIEGTAQADVGVLVISARRGEFETGFDRGGQTREHAMLAKTLGIQRLIVLVNKMDDPTVKWSKTRYDDIVGKLTPFLKKWGYNVAKEVIFIPASGMTGENIKDKVTEEVCPWYKGVSFMNLLDQLEPLQRFPNSPLRIPIIARYKDMGVVSILGKLESGTIRTGDKLIMQPGGMAISCIGLMIDDQDVEMAEPGENIVVKVKGVEEEDVHGGFVLSHSENRTKTSISFNAQVAVLDLLEHKPLITIGYSAILHIHSLAIECQISELLSAVDKKTGKKVKPRFLRSGDIGIVRITVDEASSICVEAYKDFPQMGRFTLRDEGLTISVGKVNKVHEGK